MTKFLRIIICAGFFLCMPLAHAQLAAFTDANSWDTYDPFLGGLGNSENGYYDSVYDGRYIYYSPYQSTDNGFSGEFLRYDTTGPLDQNSSWSYYDYGADIGNGNLKGYRGAAYDGRYIYFAPYGTAGGWHGNFVRYDTQGPGFTDENAWELYDVPTGLGNINLRAYHGAFFDGDYVYFTPMGEQFANIQGNLLRFNTNDPDGFQDSGSWEYKNLSGLGIETEGFQGQGFDGRYLYLLPYIGSEFVRYDMTADFSDNASYEVYNVTESPRGYIGDAVFDGRYMFFTPSRHLDGQGYHGKFARYDTQGDFTLNASWDFFDPGAEGFDAEYGVDLDTFGGGVSNGRYIIYPPYYNGSTHNGDVLMYDMTQPFDDLDSWEYFDLEGAGVLPAGGVGYQSTGVMVDGIMHFPPLRLKSDFLTFNTQYSRFQTTLSNGSVGASSEYSIDYLPLIPLENGSEIVLTFPDEYDLSTDGIDPADVNVSGAGISSAVETIDTNAGTVSFVLSTTQNVVSPVTITVGEGAADDLTNPGTEGVYGIGVDVYNASGDLIQQGLAQANISSQVSVTAIVSEALIMTLSGNSISLMVDPAVNNGQDLSESTTVNVASNSSSGYVLKARLDDGSGQARLVDGNGNFIDSDQASGENYFSYTARNDGTGSATAAEQDFGSTAANLLDDSSDTIGLETVTDSQDHTVNYDLNVNFLTPAGVYTGTIYYTVVASF